MTKSFDIAFVGHYTQDTIVSASGTRVVDGGAFNYGAHVAARMGLRVAAVSHDTSHWRLSRVSAQPTCGTAGPGQLPAARRLRAVDFAAVFRGLAEVCLRPRFFAAGPRRPVACSSSTRAASR